MKSYRNVFFICILFKQSYFLDSSEEKSKLVQKIPTLQDICYATPATFTEGKNLGDWYAEKTYENITTEKSDIYPFPYYQVSPLIFKNYLQTYKKNKKNLLAIAIDHKSISAINSLLDAGIDINSIVSTKNETLLHGMSILQPTNDQLQDWLQKGADVNAKDIIDNSPLHYSSARQPAAIKILYRAGADPNAKDFYGHTPLHIAAGINHTSIEDLIDIGANVNAEDFDGNTPLHIAAEKNHESIETLLKFGADLNKINHLKQTPLDCAAFSNPKSVPYLLEAGAHIHTKNQLGNNPLHSAVKSPTKNLESIRLLIAANAKTDEINHFGETPVDLARTMHPEAIEFFKQKTRSDIEKK